LIAEEASTVPGDEAGELFKRKKVRVAIVKFSIKSAAENAWIAQRSPNGVQVLIG
jgi:hypothetical protein